MKTATVAATLFGLVLFANAVFYAYRMSEANPVSLRSLMPTPDAASQTTPDEYEARIRALEQKVATQEQFLKENTQASNWNAPVSVADDERLGAVGRATIRGTLSGRGLNLR